MFSFYAAQRVGSTHWFEKMGEAWGQVLKYRPKGLVTLRGVLA
jgi:hypothetical protein